MKFVLLIAACLIMGATAVQQAPWSCKKNGVNAKYMLVVPDNAFKRPFKKGELFYNDGESYLLVKNDMGLVQDFTISFALNVRREVDINTWRDLFRGGLTNSKEWKALIEVYRPTNKIGYRVY